MQKSWRIGAKSPNISVTNEAEKALFPQMQVSTMKPRTRPYLSFALESTIKYKETGEYL